MVSDPTSKEHAYSLGSVRMLHLSRHVRCFASRASETLISLAIVFVLPVPVGKKDLNMTKCDMFILTGYLKEIPQLLLHNCVFY